MADRRNKKIQWRKEAPTGEKKFRDTEISGYRIGVEAVISRIVSQNYGTFCSSRDPPLRSMDFPITHMKEIGMSDLIFQSKEKRAQVRACGLIPLRLKEVMETEPLPFLA